LADHLETAGTIKREENLGEADPTYPNQTLFSSRYKLNADTALFLNERLASAPIVPIADVSQSGFASVLSQRETAIGVDSRLSKYTSLSSSYRLESGINSTDSFAVLGFMNRVPVRPDLSLDFGLEHGARITGKSGDYDSATLGFGYTPAKHIRTATHYEFRDRQGSGTILTTGLAGKLTESWTALGRFQYANTNFLGSRLEHNRVQRP
jgi:hypothetical protein